MGTAIECQQLCLLEAECNFFSFLGTQCFLVKACDTVDLAEGCISGPEEPSLESCQESSSAAPTSSAPTTAPPTSADPSTAPPTTTTPTTTPVPTTTTTTTATTTTTTTTTTPVPTTTLPLCNVS